MRRSADNRGQYTQIPFFAPRRRARAAGEQIDTHSGNLNFTLPLLTAAARGGMSVPFALSYNSQMWRKDAAGTWKLGRDVGYGFGWRLQAGSITPVYADGQLHHFVFTDSTGAVYRLSVCTDGHIWKSVESVFFEFDVTTGRLWFPNGSFWLMGSTSAGTEQDSGSRYPTLMQDSNGNQIVVRYYPGIGMSDPNTSARIQEIEDIRATLIGADHYASYTFSYNTDTIPHLTAIQFRMGLSQSFAFHYWENQSLVSPFSPPTSYENVDLLQDVQTVGLGLQHSFEYNNSSGELTKVILPYGAWLRWQYRDFVFTDGRTLREVQNRYLGTLPGGSETTYAFSRDENDSGHYIHTAAFLDGPSGNGQKAWFFNTSVLEWRLGLLSSFEERPGAGQTSKRKQEYTWTRTSNLHPYLSEVLTTIDQGTAYAKQSKTTQVLDAKGNVTESRVYGYGSLTTPVRTYTNTYAILGSPCTYCWDRLATSTMSDGTNQLTLVTNTYDGVALADITDPLRLHDPNFGPSAFYRGNLTRRVAGGLTSNFTYDITGTVVAANDGQGHSVAVTPADGTNYAAPGVITPNSEANLAQSYTYNSFLGVTSTTAPNSSISSTVYDGFGRPYTTTSPYGAGSLYTYDNSARTVKVTGGSGWTKTTMDGLGRTIKVESGYGTTVVSTVDTEYDSCGCSPLGKVKRVSQPYAPGGTVYWAVYSYDCLGRAVSVAQPDNTGTTTYVYEGNAVTVTDPAGKWKKYSTDILGNLVLVTEPDPALGNVQTNYTYNLRSQLTLVSMPRGAATQTRTFNYDLPTGRLSSATNPENGTVSYVYNADGTLFSRSDAKGQRNEYTYDSFGRVTQKRGYACSNCSAWPYVNFVYDSGTNAWGRLSSFNSNGPAGPVTMMFTYTPAGLVQQKWDYPQAAAFYTYDNEGRTVSTYYPFGGPTFTYTYDQMGRPIGLRDNQATPVDWVKDVAYNAAGQITSMSYARDPSGSSYYTETRQYNILQQLTRLTVPGVMDHEYRFSATQNDGRITQRKDWVSGEEITYQYDSLNRLISAQTTGLEWGQSFGYDGFGNLLSQTVTKGSAPSLNVTVDPATNRITNAGMSYDANGNLTAMPGRTMTYDTDNRMIAASGNFSYAYDPAGQRVRKNSEVIFYGIEGNLLATSAGGYNVYFGKKLIYNSTAAAVTDRLGSVVKIDSSTTTRYFPYGDEPTTTTQNRPKFATYYRDATTALDYAQQRYYASTLGRFTSPDLSGSGAVGSDPQSWNRYAYVQNDPVNFNDPTGELMWIGVSGGDHTVYALPIVFIVNVFRSIFGGGPKDPARLWKLSAATEVRKWDKQIADAIKKGEEDEQNRRYVKALWVVDDCYERNRLGMPLRRITYKVTDQSDQAFQRGQYVVAEQQNVVRGRVTGGGVWGYDQQNPDGTFDDFIGLQAPWVEEALTYQTFTAMTLNPSDYLANVPRPVMVVYPGYPNGPYFGVLGHWLTKDGDRMNGAWGDPAGRRDCADPRYRGL